MTFSLSLSLLLLVHVAHHYRFLILITSVSPATEMEVLTYLTGIIRSGLGLGVLVGAMD